VSTGEFYAAQGGFDYIDQLIRNFEPAEIIFQKQKKEQFHHLFKDDYYCFKMEDWVYDYDFTYEKLIKHFETNSLKGFGLEEEKLACIAAGSIMQYLEETQHKELKHVSTINRIERDQVLWMDRFTIRNLELFNTRHNDGISLISVLDDCKSALGSRLLKRWLAFPLKNKKQIDDRLEVVDYFLKTDEDKQKIDQSIAQIGDLERLASKIATTRINPREVVQLKNSLRFIQPIQNLTKASGSKSLMDIGEQLKPCLSLIDLVDCKLREDAPVNIAKGQLFKSGVLPELDDYKSIAVNAQVHLDDLCAQEAEKTGISKLKIAFNNVFGYYIEVRHAHKDKVPEHWHRKQTLVNAERYITEELKVLEQKILSAQAKIKEIENQLFNELLLELSKHIDAIQLNAKGIAQLDVLSTFSSLAEQHNYCRPELNESHNLIVEEARHPVIEQHLPLGESYIANSLYLNREDQQIMMITGPNMSGKSALLRQTALLVIMAQMGCFVPAKSAEIGLVDKVFTRVGASDNISLGESTFMVEMNETASILNNLSARSLVLLDEIGRGTSTYDGVSIAWAIAEYLHEHASKAKTLFATHYHELNDMQSQFERIKNYNVGVREHKQKIIFIRTLQVGGSEHSFGIHVAKMAGMPKALTERASAILADLEALRTKDNNKMALASNQKEHDGVQLSFFQLDDPSLMNIKNELEQVDINTLTPLEALMKLSQIKKMIGVK
ncbi:MAG: DNA mismatch repair protein MutS, partial [Flavobacteriales bacterium]